MSFLSNLISGITGKKLEESERLVDEAKLRIQSASQELLEAASEAKEQRDQLALSEKKYRNLFHNSPVGMFRLSNDGTKFLEVNNRSVEILGYDSVEDLMNVHPITICASADVFHRIQSILDNKGRVIKYIFCGRKKNGEIVTLESSMKVYPHEDYTEGTVIDVTERVRIAKLKQYAYELANQMVDLAWYKDSNLKFLFINASGLKVLFGPDMKLSDVEGLSDIDVVRKHYKGNYDSNLVGEVCQATDKKTIEARKPSRFIEIAKNLAGVEVWLDVFKVPCFATDGKFVSIVGNARLIHENMRSECSSFLKEKMEEGKVDLVAGKFYHLKEFEYAELRESIIDKS